MAVVWQWLEYYLYFIIFITLTLIQYIHANIAQFWLDESSTVQVQHQCKLHIVILDYDWLKHFLNQWYHVKWWWKFCAETWNKVFLKENKRKALIKLFWHILHANFFMFILLISNHTVFLVQFGINFHLWIFQKADISNAEVANAYFSFMKTHLC